jgi:predicted phosphodiesterase
LFSFSCSKQEVLPEQNSIPITFAVIGDYGADNENELAVANLVKSWNPDLIITVGDNNYEHGESESIDKNIGKYYHEYIGNYMGVYGEGSPENRFFPCLGNHDWYSMTKANPYLEYFTLPGNERYYDYVVENVHFFVLDSDENEPDGITSASNQAVWLKNKLSESASKFNVVYFHHAPYTSGEHGNTIVLQWPFKEWGADVVLSGHDHEYERISVDDFPYFVVGNGGRSLREFKNVIPESLVRYSSNYGAVLVKVDTGKMDFESYSIDGKLVDRYSLLK